MELNLTIKIFEGGLNWDKVFIGYRAYCNWVCPKCKSILRLFEPKSYLMTKGFNYTTTEKVDPGTQDDLSEPASPSKIA